METVLDKLENAHGGKGYITLEHVIGEKELNGKCGLFAKVTIEPGNSLGFHTHHGESETYYMLSGVGEYNDNGTMRTIKPGDVTFTPNGFGHGVDNNGTEPVVFMALIILD